MTSTPDDASAQPHHEHDATMRDATMRDAFGPGRPRVDVVDRAAVLGAVEESLLGRSSGPTRIGRYTILRQLGSGGMGLVYAAYDEELERRVAIKLLRNDLAGDDHPRAVEDRARLRQEAKALARLSHPNVVTVHEVGEHDGRIYLAMEYVRGQTAAQWSQVEDRRWSEVVEVFGAAGQGLAAAHRANLVHRDFKPANVMVADDGAVKVMDFGLARHEHAHQDSNESAGGPAGWSGDEAIDTPLTRTGTLLGTPAYMSPEQFAAAEVGPTSDQFSFCVSLYQCLYGRRPFPGVTVGELAAAVLGRPPLDPPGGTDVPRRLQEVVARGLRANPAERFESMDALLSALDPPRRSRRSTAAWLGGATLGIGVLLGLGRSADEPQRPCWGAGQVISQTWTPQRVDGVQRALSGGDAFVDVARVLSGLQDYAQGWSQARIEACQATHVRREQSEALLDLRMACLDRRLAGFDALVTELEAGEAQVAVQAVMSVTKLPGLTRCADVGYLEAEVKPPDDPAKAAQVAAMMGDVARLDALVATAQYDKALTFVDELWARVQPLRHGPLTAHVHYARGGVLQELGRPDDAATELEQGYFGAVTAGDGDRAILAGARLVFVHGVRLRDIDAALSWTKHAEAWTARLDAGDPRPAALDIAVGNALGEAGRYDDALVRLEAAVDLLEGADDARPLWLANALHNRGDVLYRLGRYDEAITTIDRAYELRVAKLGPIHPFVASTLTAQGNVALQAGDLERAAQLYERAATVQEQTLGANNPTTAGTRANLGVVRKRQGRYEDAREEIGRARDVFAAVFGPQHPSVAQALDLLAGVALEEERYDEARALLQDALRMTQTSLGPEHPKVLSSLHNLGEVALAQRRWTEAAELFARAAQGREVKLGGKHPWLALSLRGLGQARRGQGDRKGALEALQRAAEVCAASKCDVAEALDAEIVLLRSGPPEGAG